MTQPFVPEDFVVPQGLSATGFRLEPLEPQHNGADHLAWTSSIDHIHSTPGFANWKWPPADGLSLAENLRDLQGHADDFEQRTGFTYTVLDAEGVVVGCVYIYPSKSDPQVARVNSWVSADSAELDVPLYEAVSRWLEADWPFEQVQYR